MSEKMSLYLKYRPIHLDDVVGQRHIVATLKQASLNKEFAHAYLFSGHHGCGKTSTARILASLMECENAKDGKACGTCRSCKTIHAGVCVDVKELDGATNRGIDNVKMLIDAAQWSPQELKKKVYIIDECLSGQTRINTNKGLIYIRDIVNKNIDVEVLSYNEENNNFEYRPITGRFKNSGKKVYKLGFESEGRMYASEGHLISTPDGFKKVEDLSVGDWVHRQGIGLTQEQKQMLYGSLLGDASISKNRNRDKMPRITNARVRFVHGKTQKEYLNFKYLLLGKGLCNTTPKQYFHNGFKGCSEIETWRFNTVCSPSFTSIYEDITKHGRKCISEKWLKNINWMGVAFWFCDDGSLRKYKNKDNNGYIATFHTQGFSYDENVKIKKWLDSMGIECSILSEIRNKHKLYRLGLTKNSSKILLSNIWEYVPRCMEYKLKGFNPKNNEKHFYGTIDSISSLVTEKLMVKELFRFEKITYDLEVACNHNYFASGTLVHNCHQLTKEATSALLKILEEPPAYLAFILCTTEINKILPTILSRCQRFNFTKILSKDIAQRLSFIAQQEGINIDEEAVNLIAKMARGSMRDAIGYLEQIGTVAASKKISAPSIQKYFGLTDRQAITNMIKAMVNGEVALLLDQVNDMVMASADCKQILLEISEMFRNAMVIKAQNGNGKLVDLPDNEIQELKKIGEALTISQLLKLAHLFSDIEKKISFNINERWITEATLINCVSLLRKDK